MYCCPVCISFIVNQVYLLERIDENYIYIWILFYGRNLWYYLFKEVKPRTIDDIHSYVSPKLTFSWNFIFVLDLIEIINDQLSPLSWKICLEKFHQFNLIVFLLSPDFDMFFTNLCVCFAKEFVQTSRETTNKGWTRQTRLF